MSQKAYDSLITELKEIAVLGSISSLMGWDERTCMPAKGAESRSAGSALMARMMHERFTSPRIDELLSAVEDSGIMGEEHADVAVNVRETRRVYDRRRRLPSSLVEELARTSTLAEAAWIEARKKSDFPAFAPWLTKIVDLKRQQARCYMGSSPVAGVADPEPASPRPATVGRATAPDTRHVTAEVGRPTTGADRLYDALLDDFEPGETTANLRRVFDSLRKPLVDLVAQVAQSGKKPPVEILTRHYPRDVQEKLARQIAEKVGFDFAGGRIDVSAHPFSCGIAPGDHRITTRYDERHFPDAFFGTLHECGHALYTQGLPAEHFGTPCGDDISLGIHESQSRMWENLVGRSRPFWRFFFPPLKQAFGPTLADVNEDQWLAAINAIQPSLIRVEADEATYNLHILLRFELEQALLGGDLAIKDLPAAWTAKMTKYLGITPPDDARGCLQDIHWAGGAIGYFPTYTLGNLNSAQFFESARKAIGDLDETIAAGQFAPLLDWLRENIHKQGKRYTAPQLVQRITGQPLSAEPLLRHLREKAGV